jgi:hydroxyacylglutathione hydrolase
VGDAPVVHSVRVGRWSVNCYLITGGGEIVIVDPGDDPDAILRGITTLGATPVAILNTHAHFDHVGAVAALKRQYGVPFLLHRGDRRLLTQANLYRSLAGDRSVIETPIVDRFVQDGDRIPVGAVSIDVLHTPGHTQGSVCLSIGGNLLSGDTLFRDGCGRTDLPGGDAEQLAGSLARLSALDGSLTLMPGHGESCSLHEALSRRACAGTDA